MPKAIFPGEKNVIYMQSFMTYILVDYTLGAQRNVKKCYLDGRKRI